MVVVVVMLKWVKVLLLDDKFFQAHVHARMAIAVMKCSLISNFTDIFRI